MDQRRVANIAVPHDPTHVRSGPKHITGLNVIDVFHGPVHCHQMPACVAHNALGRAGRPAGIQDIGGVVAFNGKTRGRLGALLKRVPIQIMWPQIAAQLLALQNHAGFWLVGGTVDGRIKQWFISDCLAAFDTTGRSYDAFGLGVINAYGQFVGRKTAKHNRVDRPDASARQHCHNRFGNHGHVNQNAVAFAHALGCQTACKTSNFVAQLGIRQSTLAACDGAVVNDCRLIAAPCVHVAVNGVVTCVHQTVAEPLIHRRVFGKQRFGWGAVPCDLLGSAHPECFGVVAPRGVSVGIAHRSGSSQMHHRSRAAFPPKRGRAELVGRIKRMHRGAGKGPFAQTARNNHAATQI